MRSAFRGLRLLRPCEQDRPAYARIAICVVTKPPSRLRVMWSFVQQVVRRLKGRRWLALALVFSALALVDYRFLACSLSQHQYRYRYDM